MVIPDSITSIGDYAFSFCTSLKSIKIPDSVTDIGGALFYGCSELTNVELGNGITELKSDGSNGMFDNCTSLVNIVIPDSITYIDQYTFYSCTSLKNITLGNSVESIGNEAFSGCYSLMNVYFNGDVEDWCNIEFCNSNANPMYYAQKLYFNNELVTSVTVPDTITEIGDYTFCGYKAIKNITISSNVTYIGIEAFAWCEGLTNIYYSGTIEQWENIAKGNGYNAGTNYYTIHCSDGTLVE